MITGKIIFKVANLNKVITLKSFKNCTQFLWTSCQSTLIILAPILIDKKNVKMLNQALVSRLPNKAAARFTRKTKAINTAAIGPVPGIIPEKTPIPTPNAIFCGVS